MKLVEEGLTPFKEGSKLVMEGLTPFEEGSKLVRGCPLTPFKEGIDAQSRNALTRFEEASTRFEDALTLFKEASKRVKDALTPFEEGSKRVEEGSTPFEEGLKGWKVRHEVVDDRARSGGGPAETADPGAVPDLRWRRAGTSSQILGSRRASEWGSRTASRPAGGGGLIHGPPGARGGDRRGPDDALPSRRSRSVREPRPAAQDGVLQLHPSPSSGRARPPRIMCRTSSSRSVQSAVDLQARGEVYHLGVHHRAQHLHRPSPQDGVPSARVARPGPGRRAGRADAPRSHGGRASQRGRRAVGDRRGARQAHHALCRGGLPAGSAGGLPHAGGPRTSPSRTSPGSPACRRTR